MCCHSDFHGRLHCSTMAEERGEKSAAEVVLEGQQLADDALLVPVCSRQAELQPDWTLDRCKDCYRCRTWLGPPWVTVVCICGVRDEQRVVVRVYVFLSCQ